MDCRRFDEIQLGTLLGDATDRDRREAAAHARDCRRCRPRRDGDRRLADALTADHRRANRDLVEARDLLRRRFEEVRAYCGVVDGPFGPVRLARTARGLCRVSFLGEEAFLDDLVRNGWMPEHEPARLAAEMRQLERYFAGDLERFRLDVDLRVTDFQRRVLEAARRIPYGRAVSYGEIAREVGRPAAHRAVGGALGRNPVPIVVPCHRVVAADGTLGGYTGGLAIKRHLMRIEGISLPTPGSFGTGPKRGSGPRGHRRSAPAPPARARRVPSP